MFSFSVMQSSFSFSDIKIIAVATGISVYNLSHLATAKSIFVRKERFNATSALKNHSKVNAPGEFINTRHNGPFPSSWLLVMVISSTLHINKN